MPFNNHPNFSRAFFAISGLGVFEGGNSSFQWNGLQALISATECVMLPALRRSGGIAGSALESHEPLMNWIDSAGSVRVIALQNDDICYQDGGNSYVRGYSGGAQKRWLENELEGVRSDSDIDWVVVCMHQTAVSTGNGA